MRTRLIALTLLTVFAVSEVALAAPLGVTGEDQKDVMVTIYNGNLGLVKDVREARFPAGVTEIQFMDVAAQIDPTTVHLKSLTDPAGLKILEQNYEYDLLTSQKLMEKYVGKKVRLYQGDGTFHEAKLLWTKGPIFEINGQIHMGHYGRLVLPSLPENLVAQPTLVWLLRNQATRPQRVEVSYLTGGITWKADYVMVIDAADTLSDLTGWVTIDNKSGATYKNAALKLVAGDVNRAQDGGGGRREPRVPVRGVLRVPPLHARRPNDGQGQPDQAALAHGGGRGAGGEAPHVLRRPGLLPERLRHAHLEPEGRRLPRDQEQQGEPARDPAAEGQDPRLQGRPLGQSAVHRRGLDRPHAEGRTRQDQDG